MGHRQEKAIFLHCVGDVGVSGALGSPQNRRRECRDRQHSPPATAAPLNVTLAYAEALSDPGPLEPLQGGLIRSAAGELWKKTPVTEADETCVCVCVRVRACMGSCACVCV